MEGGETADANSGQDRIFALEQRLYLLGYLFAEPDGIWDEKTEEALDVLASAAGTKRDDPVIMELIAEMTDRLSHAVYYVDRQLETAYKLLRHTETEAA